MRRVLGFLVALVLVMAGCLADDDPVVTEDLEDEEDQGPSTSESTGAIEGTVSSDLFEPLRAEILLYDEDRDEVLKETTATKDGTFAFKQLDPGTYVLQARLDGYRSNVRGADVKAGESSEVEFQLTPVASDEPYIIEDQIDGKINGYSYRAEIPGQGCLDLPNTAWPVPPNTCSSSQVPYTPTLNTQGQITNSDNETKTVLLEMAWEAPGLLGENLVLVIACDDAVDLENLTVDTDHPCFMRSSQMESPAVLRVDESHWLDHEYKASEDWFWWVTVGHGMLGTNKTLGVDAGIAWEQTYSIYFSIFQREGAPDGFSRLPDS